MYGINRCPRCAGYRLLRQSPQGVLVVCAGCGLVTTEPAPPPRPTAIIARTGIANRSAEHQWNAELPALSPPCHR
jgi:uncharacterized Zn finger protein